MKIIYLISRAISSDGPVNQALNILTGLNRISGVEAILVTLSPELENKSWLWRFIDNGIKVFQLNQSPKNIYKCISILRSYIRENHIDIVHSSGYRADFVNMHLCDCVTTISTQRSNPKECAEEFPKLLRPLINRYHIHIIKALHSQVACSRSLQNIFRDEEGMNIECVQNAVNTEYFKPLDSIAKTKLRAELGLPIDHRIFLVLGVLLPRKNNKVIIKAFNNAKIPRSKLVFVGGGSDESYLKDLAGENPNIIFAGVTSNPLKYLQAADILVSSSLAEGLPNTVLEALSCGLPAILSNINPHKELINQPCTGFFFDPSSVPELVAIFKDSTQWDMAQMSMTARDIAENKFSITMLANNYLNIYRKYLK